MAITTNYEGIKSEFNPRYWNSIEEFESFYLQELAETLADTNYYTNKNGEETKISPVNHYPELKEYEVWMEGYAATGESGTANLVGKTKARNFAQACHILMCEEKLKNIAEENKPNNNDYVTAGRWDYNPNRLSYWGRKLYWSYELASKSFG